MNKRLVILVVMVLLFTLFGLGKSNLFGPKIDAPVFVKSLIYSEDMDIDLNYIAPRRFNKSVEKVQIPNAPKGIDCVVYGEEKEAEGKYTVSTVNIGVNCDYWNEETGIGNDLELNRVLVTWNDGSQTTEDIGRITIVGGNRNKQGNNYMDITEHGDTRKATYTLTKDTEITGLKFPYPDELLNIISNITINDRPLEDVSIERPIKLKKNETCIVEYQVNDENKFQFGNIHVTGSLLGKSNKSGESIANFVLLKRFGSDESARGYFNKK
ncbi:hypothetical protein [Aminipila sp.]|uniref:hypothetical protein n=1 Tax=Aminipila sp. TaxID=2060095 RepID=UPI00289778BB|nr:hypothetical protein [Aminipila sp.]